MNIAIVGLGFGAEFIPIYQKHPHANMYAICQRSESALNKVGDAFNIDPGHRYRSYEKLLKDPEIDAVHINTPIQFHAETHADGSACGQACFMYCADGNKC